LSAKRSHAIGFLVFALFLASCEGIDFTPHITPLVIVTVGPGASMAPLLPSETEDALPPIATGTPTLVPPTAVMPSPTSTQVPRLYATLLYTVQENDYCSGIASSFGLSLDDLKAANPQALGKQDNPRCFLTPGQQLTIPPLPVDRIPEYIEDFQHYCNELKLIRPKGVCLTASDRPEVMIAHTLMGEGELGYISANVMQVVLNRLAPILANRGIDPEALTREEYGQVLIYLMAQPYEGSDGQLYPAFNAFGAPVDHPGQGEPGDDDWLNNLAITEAVLLSRGESWPVDFAPKPAVTAPDVIYYCAGRADDPPFDVDDKEELVAHTDWYIVKDPLTGKEVRIEQWYYKNGRQFCH